MDDKCAEDAITCALAESLAYVQPFDSDEKREKLKRQCSARRERPARASEEGTRENQ